MPPLILDTSILPLLPLHPFKDVLSNVIKSGSVIVSVFKTAVPVASVTSNVYLSASKSDILDTESTKYVVLASLFHSVSYGPTPPVIAAVILPSSNPLHAVSYTHLTLPTILLV